MKCRAADAGLEKMRQGGATAPGRQTQGRNTIGVPTIP